jgi:lysozyme
LFGDTGTYSRFDMIRGIDVSHWQGNIRWDLVGATDIRFCYIKATEGTDWSDWKFEFNRDNCAMENIDWGPYHFFLPEYSPLLQARHFLSRVEGWRLTPAIDVEANYKGLDYGVVANRTKEMLDYVEEGIGRKPVIYTGGWFWDRMSQQDWADDYYNWLADYRVISSPRIPIGMNHWDIWQHTSKGHVNGISGYVDLNKFNGTETDYRKLLKIESPLYHVKVLHPPEVDIEVIGI